MTLPVVSVSGHPYEQGRQHGVALRAEIAHNLGVYYDRFQREAQLPPDEARSRAATFGPLLERHAYSAALRGMAEGSGQTAIDLLVLNLRYELLYYQYGICAMRRADGCTAFAVLPSASANGHMLLGQNWDWIPAVQGAVIFTREPDGLETLAFTEAGIVGGKIGLNSAGLGLTINGLSSTADDWSRQVMPFHVRCYEILRCSDLKQAAGRIAEGSRSCSANFLLAQTPDRALDIEAAPDAVRLLESVDGRLVHTNHFLNPGLLDIAEPPIEPRPHSFSRLARMSALLDARRPVGVSDLEVALRDHHGYPDSVCRHEHPDDAPEERCVTVTSAIMDLHERSLRLTDGPPCQHAYEDFSIPRAWQTEC